MSTRSFGLSVEAVRPRDGGRRPGPRSRPRHRRRDRPVARHRTRQGPDGTKCLALLDAGDVAGAWTCMRRTSSLHTAPIRRTRRRRTRRAVLARIGGGSRLSDDRRLPRDLGGQHARVPDQLRRHGLRQPGVGSHWDVDPADVVARPCSGTGSRTGVPARPRTLVRRSIAGRGARHLPGEGTSTSSMATGRRSSRGFVPYGRRGEGPDEPLT